MTAALLRSPGAAGVVAVAVVIALLVQAELLTRSSGRGADVRSWALATAIPLLGTAAAVLLARTTSLL